MLLQGEVARIEEFPESTTVSGGENLCPCFTEDESDNLKEELRNVNGLRTEVENLTSTRVSVKSLKGRLGRGERLT